VWQVLERHRPHRLTAPAVFGSAKAEAEVRATFSKSQRFLALTAAELNRTDHGTRSKSSIGQNRRRLLADALKELGHSPRDDDLRFCLETMSRSEMSADSFWSFYCTSNWAKPMLAGAFEQLEETVRSKRNKFLLSTVKLPEQDWGFARDQWGFPETALWRSHGSNLVKEQLQEVWVKQRRSAAGGGGAGADAGGEEELDLAEEKTVAVRLEDGESVRAAPMLKVAEALALAMSKSYLSRLLPDADSGGNNGGDSDVFDEARRSRWVGDVVADCSLGQAAEQITFYQLAAQQRKFVREAGQREASKARKREKAARLQRWLAEQTDCPSDELPPDGVSVADVALEIVKAKLKDELKEVVLGELTDAWELLKVEASGKASEFWGRHWLALCSCGALAVAAPTIVLVKILRM